MNFMEMFQMLGGNLWFYGGAFILVLSVLVFVHEWGHYIVARLCGIRVEVFSIGFGRELLGFNDKNGTRWKVSLVPLGGYVKLFGDVDPASAGHTDNVEEGDVVRPMTEVEKREAFFAQPVWKRALVVFAGPAINYIFAFIILAAMFTFNGRPVTPPSAAAIIVGSSAESAQFEPHDEIISIGGKKISTFEDIRREMMIALDTEKHFVVRRGDELIDIYAKPEKRVQEDRFGFKHSIGLLGLISPRHAVKSDMIVSINGRNVETKEDAQRILSENMETTLNLEIKNGQSSQTLIVHPIREFNPNFNVPDSAEYGVLILSNLEANKFLKYGPGEALAQAYKECWDITVGTIEALGQMITGTRSASELGGVIRIGALAGDMAKQGLIALIMFSALLSINLGLINLFPIPMLDGGHLVFYSLEAVLGRPVPERFQEYAFRMGLVFLVGVMVYANLNDLMQLLL